jgi:hypothetical protein
MSGEKRKGERRGCSNRGAVIEGCSIIIEEPYLVPYLLIAYTATCMGPWCVSFMQLVISNSLYCHLHGPLVRIVCAEAVEELNKDAVHLVQCMSTVYEYSV